MALNKHGTRMNHARKAFMTVVDQDIVIAISFAIDIGQLQLHYPVIVANVDMLVDASSSATGTTSCNADYR